MENSLASSDSVSEDENADGLFYYAGLLGKEIRKWAADGTPRGAGEKMVKVEEIKITLKGDMFGAKVAEVGYEEDEALAQLSDPTQRATPLDRAQASKVQYEEDPDLSGLLDPEPLRSTSLNPANPPFIIDRDSNDTSNSDFGPLAPEKPSPPKKNPDPSSPDLADPKTPKPSPRPPTSPHPKTHTNSCDRFKQLVSRITNEHLPLPPTFFTSPSIFTLINSNISDFYSRYLLIFTENSIIDDIIVKKIRTSPNPRKHIYLTGSPSKSDQLSLVSLLPTYMSYGYIVIMKNLDHLYSCFYELFNQRFIESQGEKWCYMVFGSVKQLCKVHKDFKVRIFFECWVGGHPLGS